MENITLEEFTSLYKKTFPSIDYKEKELVKDYFAGFEYNCDKFFTIYEKKFILQGDLLSNIKFILISENEDVLCTNTIGMVLSNTCDIKQDKFIIMAPVFPFEYFNEIYPELKKCIDSLKKNLIFRFFYVPSCYGNPEFVVDFTKICSYEKTYLINKIKKNSTKKVLSLTQLGYYLLILKLTIHLLRSESVEVKRG